jgi:hypothetical protein
MAQNVMTLPGGGGSIVNGFPDVNASGVGTAADQARSSLARA